MTCVNEHRPLIHLSGNARVRTLARCSGRWFRGADLQGVYSALEISVYYVLRGSPTPRSTCSAKCGGGVMSRQREIVQYPANGGKPCQGGLHEVQGCNMQECSGAVLNPGKCSGPGQLFEPKAVGASTLLELRESCRHLCGVRSAVSFRSVAIGPPVSGQLQVGRVGRLGCVQPGLRRWSANTIPPHRRDAEARRRSVRSSGCCRGTLLQGGERGARVSIG